MAQVLWPGTINIISQDVAAEPSTAFDLMLGENEYHKLQFSHSDKLSDSQGYRVSGSYLSNDGWREHTGSERAEINIRHEFEISANERLVTSLIVSDLEQEMAGSLNEDLYKNDKKNSGLSDAVLASDPLRKSQYLRLATQWDKITEHSFYSLIPYIRIRSNDYTATWNQNMPKVESQVSTVGLLALANFEHKDENETTLGLDVEFTEGEQLSYQPLDFTTSGWNADTFIQGEKFYDDTTTYVGISPYLQHKRALGDELFLTLGARYDYAEYDFDNHLGVYGDIGHGKQSLKNKKDYFSHFSPKASLNYKFSDDSSIYLRYANSFRLPTAGSIYHLTTKDSGDAKAVDPEVSDTFELGYKFNGENISFDAALYYMDVDDGIVHAYNSNGQRFLTNASRVVHKGFEIAVNWQVNQSVNLTTAYTLAEHEFDEHEKLSGNDMSSAPEYIANVRLRYNPVAIEGLSTMVEVQSIGEYWLDDANSSDDNGIERKDNGYTVANVKASYQINNKLTLNARLLNITDKEYVQEASFRYGKTRYSAGAPRTLYIGLSYQW